MHIFGVGPIDIKLALIDEHKKVNLFYMEQKMQK